MCVAIAIIGPSPSLSDLRLMEKDNPHGGGIAWAARRGGIQYLKNISAKDIHGLLAKIPRPVLAHFRIATHGAVIPQLCHPFPLGEQAFSTDLSGKADAVLIHNGVWAQYKTALKAVGLEDSNDMSDTQLAAFIADKDEDVLDSLQWSNAVGRIGRRGVMDIKMRGTWSFYKGVMYSNLKWTPNGTPGRYGTGYGSNYSSHDSDYSYTKAQLTVAPLHRKISNSNGNSSSLADKTKSSTNLVVIKDGAVVDAENYCK